MALLAKGGQQLSGAIRDVCVPFWDVRAAARFKVVQLDATSQTWPSPAWQLTSPLARRIIDP